MVNWKQIKTRGDALELGLVTVNRKKCKKERIEKIGSVNYQSL